MMDDFHRLVSYVMNYIKCKESLFPVFALDYHALKILEITQGNVVAVNAHIFPPLERKTNMREVFYTCE